MPEKYDYARMIQRGAALRFPAVLLGLLLLLAACGTNGATTTTGGSSAPTPTPTAQSQSNTTTGNNYGGYGNSTSSTTPTTQAAATGPRQSVSITGQNGAYSFSPATMTIPVGTTIVWTNHSDTVHTVTSDDGGKTFDSGTSHPIDSNGTFSFTFTKAGTYTYHCQFHPSMKATIIVQ